MNIKIPKVDLTCICFALYIILSQYTFSANTELLNWGNLMLICLVFLQIRKLKKIEIDKMFLLFVISMILIQLIVHFQTSTFGIFSNMIFYGGMTIICSCFIKKEYFYNVYKMIGIISTVVIIVQYIQIYLLHTNPISVVLSKFHNWEILNIRPCSFFSEPQAYVSFVIFLVIWSIVNKEYRVSIFVSLGIICSTSSLGIFLVVFVWGIYVYMIKGSTPRKIWHKLILILILIIGIFLFFNLSMFEYSVSKILDINIIMDNRLSRGFWTYVNLPFLQKIFGVGFYNLTTFLHQNGIYLSWIEGSIIPEYNTALSAILIYFGIVPFILFIYMIKRLFVKYGKTMGNVMFLGCIFLMMASQTALFNTWFFYIWSMYFIFSYVTKKEIIIERT